MVSVATTTISTPISAAAKGQSSISRTCCETSVAIISSCGLPTSAGVTKKPSAERNTIRQPLHTPARLIGSSTSKKARRRLAPSMAAARM